MAITYASQTGTLISSFAMDETCINQTDQVGNNTIVVSDDISTAGNGNIGDGTYGIGVSYVGRLIIVNLGASQQVRMCTAETAGTTVTNSLVLTVHEDWDTNPVVTTDTVHVPYEPGDIDFGGAGGGIAYGTRTGLWSLSNTLTIGNATDPAGFMIPPGVALECDDDGANISFYGENNSHFYCGYEGGGSPIGGAIMTAFNNTTGEPWTQFKSGSTAYIYDSLMWAQLRGQQWEGAAGCDVNLWGTKIISGADEAILYGHTITNGSVSGRGATTDIVRVDDTTVCNGLVLADVYSLDSAADTTTETLELSGVTFASVPNYVSIRLNKTWNLIDPTWNVTTYTELDFIGAGLLYDLRSVQVTVQEADGTKLQNALVLIYEGTILDDLTLETLSDANGLVDDAFQYKAHTNAATTTYGGHAFRVDKWLYTPFVSTQTSTESRSGVITLLSDLNIVQTTQATALTAGSTITWNKDTNPSELFDFTLGSGTLADGMIITFTSGAVGTITGLQSGNSVAGEVHLKDRNATAIANGDTFSRTGGTAGTFSGTYTNDSKQPFTIWADGKDLSMQTVYDYFAALTSETTLSATGELIHEWGKGNQGRALYKGGNGFYTERSGTEGLFITNFGAGTISHFTDDAGNTWVPPIQYSFAFTLAPSITGYEWRIYSVTAKGSLDGATELAGEETATADNQSYAYVYSSDFFAAVQIIDDNYEESITYYDISNSDQSVTINLTPEDNL